MEDDNNWHYRTPNEKEYKEAIKENEEVKWEIRSLKKSNF